MSERAPIPRPVPQSEMPVMAIPPEYQAKPGPVEVVTAQPGEQALVAVVAKRTYRWAHNCEAVAAEVQRPLYKGDEPHEPLEDVPLGDEPPMTSLRRVPEVFARRPGTDVIVHGRAVPTPGAVSMSVSMRVGTKLHAATVTGDRLALFEPGGIRFTDPAELAPLPLRHELAFGGLDRAAGQRFLQGVQDEVGLMAFRRTATYLRKKFIKAPPFSYARNMYGRGYVTDPSQPWQGGPVALPNIERPGDELTPERLGGNPAMAWSRLPIPALFGFLDANSFPRSAMSGLPPAFDVHPDEMPEVRAGLLVKGYCPGSWATVKPEDVPKMFNPDMARTAPLGLRFDYLRPGEVIFLRGMGGLERELAVLLPREAPMMSIPGAGGGGRDLTMGELELQQVLIDVDAGELEVVWSGVAPIAMRQSAGQALAWRDVARVDWRPL